MLGAANLVVGTVAALGLVGSLATRKTLSVPRGATRIADRYANPSPYRKRVTAQ